MNGIFGILEESYRLFEAKKISGLDYRDYLALLLFTDAFLDVVQKEYPTVAEKVTQPGIPLLDSVWEYFDELDLDIWTFVDRRPAYEMVKNLNLFWKNEFTAEDLAKFNEDDLIDLTLFSVGRDVKVGDNKLKAMLQDRGLELPTVSDLGVHLDTKRYEAVYKSLGAIIGKQVTESRQIPITSFIRSAIDSLTQARKHLDSKKIYILDRVISDLENFL